MKRSMPENMLIAILQIFHHVLKTLDIDAERHQLLIDQGFDYIINLVHTKNDTYQ